MRFICLLFTLDVGRAGTIVEVTGDRARDLIARGFAKGVS